MVELAESSIGESPTCGFKHQGRTITARLDLQLPFDQPTQIWEGMWVHGWFVRVGTSLYVPGETVTFYLDHECFGNGQEVTLAVADHSHNIPFPSWEAVPWIWQQRYTTVLQEGQPLLIRIGTAASLRTDAEAYG